MNKVPLPGSERPEPPGTRVGKPSPDERISVYIVLRPRSSKGERFPQRPANRRLSREELATLHGADPQDVAKIEAFATESNLLVDEVHPAKRTIDLSGRTADFSKAFQVDLAQYESEGKRFLGHAGHTYVPAELVSLIQGVFGLDNRPLVRSSTSGPSSSPALHLSDVTAAYNFPTGGDGSGETIAILTFDSGYSEDDLKVFFAFQGTSVPTHKDVSIDGAVNNHLPKGEVGMDIQIAGGVAPGAQIVIYFFQQTNSSLLHAVQTAVADRPSVISMSFGVTEGLFSSITEAEERTIDQVFQNAADLSITVLSATGDQGGTDGSIFGTPHVEFPASSPNVTACGGSIL